MSTRAQMIKQLRVNQALQVIDRIENLRDGMFHELYPELDARFVAETTDGGVTPNLLNELNKVWDALLEEVPNKAPNRNEKTKHTPGPWVLERESDRYIHIVNQNEDIGVASVSIDPDGIDPDTANARLIAAAPELLESSKRILRNLENYTANTFDGSTQDAMVYLTQAIAKATGGAE